MRSIAIFAVLVLLAAPAVAATIRVPDDAATIQEAVDRAGDGDTVRIAAGSYGSFTIAGKPGLTVRGRGDVTVTGTASAAITVTNSDGVVLRGLGIVSANTGAYEAIDCTHSEYLQVRDCRLTGTMAFGDGASNFEIWDTQITGGRWGIHFSNSEIGPENPGFSLVANCELTNVETGIESTGGQVFLVDRVDFSLIASVGILVHDAPTLFSASVNIIRCNFEFIGEDGTAISVESAGIVRIRRCRIEDVEGTGISLTPGVTEAVIDRTTLARVRDWAIDLGRRGDDSSTSDRFTVTRCSVTEAGGGIRMFARGDLGIDRTRFTHVLNQAVLASHGERAYDEARIVMRRCRVTDAGDTVLAISGKGSLIEKCRLSGGAPSIGILLWGSDTTVRKVRIDDVINVGIEATGAGYRMDRCRIAGADAGTAIRGDRAVLTGNRVSRARLVGIQLASNRSGAVGSATCTVERNRLTDVGDGFRLLLDGGLVERNKVTRASYEGFDCRGERTQYIGNTVSGAREGFHSQTGEFLFRGNRAIDTERCGYWEGEDEDQTTNTFEGNGFGTMCFDD